MGAFRHEDVGRAVLLGAHRRAMPFHDRDDRRRERYPSQSPPLRRDRQLPAIASETVAYVDRTEPAETRLEAVKRLIADLTPADRAALPLWLLSRYDVEGKGRT